MTLHTRLVQPSTAEDVTRLLGEPESKIFGGGTDLVPNRTWGLDTSGTWVQLRAVPEATMISLDEEGQWSIGAAVTLKAILEHPKLPGLYPLLAGAIMAVATPEIRNQATIGGNLCLDTRCRFRNQPPIWRLGLEPCFKSGGSHCYAAPASSQCVAILSSDTAPAFIALGARLKVHSRSNSRWIEALELYTGDGDRHLTLAPGEWIETIRLPSRPPLGVFDKWRIRKSIDFPEVNVAISVAPGENSREMRMVLGAVAPGPIRLREAERLLAQGPWDQDRLVLAAHTVTGAIHPYDNGQMGVVGRKRAAEHILYRALGKLRNMMGEKGVSA